MLSLPPTENGYIAQKICEELRKVKGEKRDEIIKLAADDLLKLYRVQNVKLANAVEKELKQCYPSIFAKDRIIA